MQSYSDAELESYNKTYDCLIKAIGECIHNGKLVQNHSREVYKENYSALMSMAEIEEKQIKKHLHDYTPYLIARKYGEVRATYDVAKAIKEILSF